MDTKLLVPLAPNRGMHVSVAGHASMPFQMGILKYLSRFRVEEITEITLVKKG